MVVVLLNTQRMARRLRVTQAWLKQEVEANRVPYLDADGRLLFNAHAVERCLAQRAAGDYADETGTTHE